MFALAWRNLWRQRRRSLVTAGAVALVVYLSIVYFGFGGASKNSFYGRLTEESGHVQVRAPGWRDARGLEDALIRNAGEVRATVEEVASARLERPIVSGVLDVPALLSGEVRSRGVPLHGRDWSDAMRERRLEGATLDGRFVADVGDVVLGTSLARALDVGLGDEVFAYAPESEGLGAAAYTVVGLVDLLDPNQEIATAWISLADAQELAAPDGVTRFEIHAPSLVRLADDMHTDELAAALDARLPELDALSWRALDPSIVRIMDALDPMLFGVSVLFFVLAGLLVLNTVYLSVMERIRELGVILSLGAGGRRVIGMIASESVLLCGLGAVVGTAAGLATIAALADGFEIPGLGEYYASFGLDPVWYLSVTPGQVVFTLAFAVVTALAAATWPAIVAARLEPVEAMRFQA